MILIGRGLDLRSQSQKFCQVNSLCSFQGVKARSMRASESQASEASKASRKDSASSNAETLNKRRMRSRAEQARAKRVRAEATEPTQTISGDYSLRDPPVPIPNTEVKPQHADGTWLETARESRSSPDSILHGLECAVLFHFPRR